MSEVEGQQFTQFVMKDRSCPDIGSLKIGEFARFPLFASLPQPAMFSTDLIRASRNTLRFLSAVDVERGVSAKLRHTCEVRYPAFLKLQAKAPESRIVPPLDVAVG